MENHRMNSCGCCQPNSVRRVQEYSANSRRTSDTCPMTNQFKENRKMSIGENIDGLPLGMAYVPMQHYDRMFDLGRGLREGTIFPELCLPFCGKRRKCSC